MTAPSADLPVVHGLTWDHPRGYNPLAATAARAHGVRIEWHRQPLEGFESAPIADLCQRHDLVVMDHPHVGEAVAAGCLIPLEELFSAAEIAGWQDAAVGQSMASYRYAGQHWALPLDAATQVMAYAPHRIPRPPAAWDALPAFAARHPLALSLAGPHAILSFQSIAAAFGQPRASDQFVDPAIATHAYGLMLALTTDATRRAAQMNPIAMLAALASGDGPAVCPLIYGYVNYATRGVAFTDAPHGPDGRIGSMLGGTGIALSRRAMPAPALLDHLRWLMSDAAQADVIPAHDGQPALRCAWQSATVNAAAGGFFAATRATIEAAALRPRHDGAIAFQTAASARLRGALLDGEPAAPVLAALETLYRAHHPNGAET